MERDFFVMFTVKIKFMGIIKNLTAPRFSEVYEFGLPDFKKKCDVILVFKDDKLTITFLKGLLNKKVVFEPNDIIDFDASKGSKRSGGKAATGAVVGGLLTGGIGLIAGGLIGGRRRADNQVAIRVKHKNIDCDIVLTTSKSTPGIVAEIQKMMMKRVNIEEATETNNVEGISEEIEKLHQLFKKGILTEEEFQTKKTQLLK